VRRWSVTLQPVEPASPPSLTRLTRYHPRRFGLVPVVAMRSCSIMFGLALCCVVVVVTPCSATLTADELTFVQATSAEGARTHLNYYTSIDHVAGTDGDYETATYTQAQMQDYGLQAEIIPFRVLLNYPLNRSLDLISGTPYSADLSEDIFPEDPTSDNRWRNRTFHGQ
jgi:hypothetical protein